MKTNRHFLFVIHALVVLAFNLAMNQAARADFILTGSLNTNRYSGTATLLTNGKVLFAGGLSTSGYLSGAELYDPASGFWTNTGSMATPRSSHTATLLTNGQVLVAGGANTSGDLASAELYNPVTGTWTTSGSMSAKRIGFTATLLPNGQVLVAAGNGAGGYLTNSELYDPGLGTWTNTGSLAIARESHTATLLTNGLVLVAGGANNSGFISSAELYNPTSGTWTTTGSAPPRYLHTATLLANGQVLVAGGADGSGWLASATLYDPVMGTWLTTGPMNVPHGEHTATLLPDGEVLVVAGLTTNGQLTADAELYNPISANWSATLGPLNIPRVLHTATLLPDGQVLVAGGETNNVALGSAELYLDMATLKMFLEPAGAVAAGAQWRVDGGPWQNSGATVTNLIAGYHTVAFNTIPGWLTPSNEVYFLASGAGYIITAASYVSNPGVGALQVTINPICAVANGAEWQVDGGAWQTSGSVVTNLAGGSHTVSFTNVVGWLAPSSQTVMVTANTTNTATGDYIEGSTPGVITWINIGGPDQHWSTAANWDLNRAPTTNDIVLIPNTGGSTCLMDVDATVAGLVIGDCDSGGSDGLEINGHTLTVAGVLTVKSNAVFRVDSGILAGTSNTIISGVLGWTSGGLAGTLTLSSSGVLNISGNPGGQYFSGCTFTNYGSVNWSGNALSAGGSVVIDNYGLWNAEDDHYFYGPNVVFNNYGTFRKSGGVGGYPGTYFYNGAVFNQLAGVLDVQSGTNGLELTLASGGSLNGGYVTTNSNGVTLLGNNFNINGTITCSNVVCGGNLIGTNVISGGLTWQNGQWNSIVVTVSSNSVLTINNSAFSKGISGSMLTNYGTVNWSAAAINGDGGTVIDNYGVWNAQDDQYLNGGTYGVVFNNYGTFRKSGGVGGYPGTYFNSGAVFNQLAGVLDIQSGTNGLWLSLTSGGSFSGGYVTTNLNGITSLGGNFNINGGITCSNVISGGNLIGTNVIRGGLTWQNGQWNNTVVTVSSNSVLTLDNPTYQKGINGSMLTNYGTVNWSAAAINGDGGTVIDNYGVWNAQDNQYFNGGAGVVFNNFGKFLKSGGVGGYPGTYFYGGTTFNQAGGTLSVQTGDVTLGGTYSLTNGTLNFGINSLIDNGRLQLGTLTLGGTLSATVSGSFAPAVGDEFGVIGSSGLNGGFTSANLPAGIVVSNINNTVFLIVTGPVPVQLLNPQPVGTNFLFQFPTVSGQSYTVQRNDVLSSTNWVYYTNITGSGTLFQFQTPVTVTPPQRFFRVRQP